MAKRAAIRLPQSETQTATDLCHFYVEFLAGRFNETEFSSFNPPFCGESFGITASSLVRKWKSKLRAMRNSEMRILLEILKLSRNISFQYSNEKKRN